MLLLVIVTVVAVVVVVAAVVAVVAVGAVGAVVAAAADVNCSTNECVLYFLAPEIRNCITLSSHTHLIKITYTVIIFSSLITHAKILPKGFR